MDLNHRPQHYESRHLDVSYCFYVTNLGRPLLTLQYHARPRTADSRIFSAAYDSKNPECSYLNVRFLVPLRPPSTPNLLPVNRSGMSQNLKGVLTLVMISAIRGQITKVLSFLVLAQCGTLEIEYGFFNFYYFTENSAKLIFECFNRIGRWRYFSHDEHSLFLRDRVASRKRRSGWNNTPCISGASYY